MRLWLMQLHGELLTLDSCPQFEMHAAFSLVVDPSLGVTLLADTTPALWDVWHLKKAVTLLFLPSPLLSAL